MEKKYTKQGFTTIYQPNIWHELITFMLEDREWVVFPHDNALIILIVLSNHHVYRVLVDYGSAVNILSRKMMCK